MKSFAKLAAALLAMAAVPALAETHYIETPGPNPDYVSPEQKAKQHQIYQNNLCLRESQVFAIVGGDRNTGDVSPDQAYRDALRFIHEAQDNVMTDDLTKKIVNFVYFNEKAQGLDFASDFGTNFTYSYCMRDWQPAHDWQPVK
jgi:hypothetical protein